MYYTRVLKKTRKSHYPLSVISILLVIFMSIFLGCNKNSTSPYNNNNNTGGTPGTNEIFMQGMAFSPANKTISAGTTIKWTNKDSMTHTVTSGTPGAPSGLFDSGNLASNDVFSFTFSQPGTFKYYCNIHSSMTGTITVQ